MIIIRRESVSFTFASRSVELFSETIFFLRFGFHSTVTSICLIFQNAFSIHLKLSSSANELQFSNEFQLKFQTLILRQWILILWVKSKWQKRSRRRRKRRGWRRRRRRRRRKTWNDEISNEPIKWSMVIIQNVCKLSLESNWRFVRNLMENGFVKMWKNAFLQWIPFQKFYCIYQIDFRVKRRTLFNSSV